MPTSIEYLKSLRLNPNVQAAIKTIRTTEGTTAADGYYYLFGSSPKNTIRFTSLETHPNRKETHNGITSTAAGIGQILYKTYVAICDKYGFKDFSKETQELMIMALWDDCGTLNSISKGFIFRADVMTAISKIWASLPMSPYGQPTHSLAETKTYYLNSGGTIA